MTQRRRLSNLVLFTLLLGPCVVQAWSATLEVGHGKTFRRIEDANAAAAAGDVILVYPLAENRPYQQTAVYVRRANLTFRAVPADGAAHVAVSGKGFDYSGRGSTPRAIFQFNRGADGCLLEGFELSDAHNDSQNGAGVRISFANRVTVRGCSIHSNDMGVMSGGDGTETTAVDQRFERCVIHHNGNFDRAGFNHNLYLGGTSVTLTHCEVHSSLTGHNVKSRAHHTRVEYSYIHHSANREFDLVDAADTARPESDAVLLGNVIVKDPRCRGNKCVVHFGQDGGGRHDGTLHLAFNTIVTPFITPLVDLSAPKTKVRLTGNLVSDGGVRQAGQTIARARNGADLAGAGGSHNWFSGGFSPPDWGSFPLETNIFRRSTALPFVAGSAHDYRPTPQAMSAMGFRLTADDVDYPPLRQYKHPADGQGRSDGDWLMVGAYGRTEP